NSRLETLAGVEEEGILANAELTATESSLAGLGIDGINDNTVLARAKDSNLNLSDDLKIRMRCGIEGHLLIDIGNMGLGVLEGDEPLLTSLAGFLELVNEGPLSTKTESLRIIKKKIYLSARTFLSVRTKALTVSITSSSTLGI